MVILYSTISRVAYCRTCNDAWYASRVIKSIAEPVSFVAVAHTSGQKTKSAPVFEDRGRKIIVLERIHSVGRGQSIESLWYTVVALASPCLVYCTELALIGNIGSLLFAVISSTEYLRTMSMVAQQASLFAFYFQQRSCETLKIRQSFCRIYGVLETNNRTFGFDAVHSITVARFIVIFREEFTSFDPLSRCPVHEGADNVPRRMKNEPTIFLRFLPSIGHNTLLETIRTAPSI